MNLKVTASLLTCLALSSASRIESKDVVEEGKLADALLERNFAAAELLISSKGGGALGDRRDFCRSSLCMSRSLDTAKDRNVFDLILQKPGTDGVREMLELLWAHGAPTECESTYLVDDVIKRGDFALATRLVEKGAKLVGRYRLSVIALALSELCYGSAFADDVVRFVAAVLEKSEPSSPLLSSALHLVSHYVSIRPEVGVVAKMLLEHKVPVTAETIHGWISENSRYTTRDGVANMSVFFKSLPNPFAHFGQQDIADMIDTTSQQDRRVEPEVFYSKEALHASLNAAREAKMGHLHTAEVVWSGSAESVLFINLFGDQNAITRLVRGTDGKFKGDIHHTLGTPMDFRFIVDGRWRTSLDYAVVDGGHGRQNNRLW